MSGTKQITIELGGGKLRMTDCAARLGHVAVTRCLDGDGDGWRLTHVPTGFAAPFVFPSAVAAEQAMREVDEVCDWTGLVKSLADGSSPNVAPLVIEICEGCGGERSEEVSMDRPELKRRLVRLGAA